MTTGQKLLGGGLLAWLFWWTSKEKGPRITVLQITNPPLKPGDPGYGLPMETFAYWPTGIVFEMSVDGHTMTDTIYAGDQNQVIEAGDGVHQFASEWSELNNDSGALLTIRERKANGTYDAIASGYISAYFPSHSLPTNLS